MSTIDNAKIAMGWVHQNSRASCGNCARVQMEAPLTANKPIYRCGMAGFITPRYAICDQHTPMTLTGGTQG
jgi:hypothetical protein